MHETYAEYFKSMQYQRNASQPISFLSPSITTPPSHILIPQSCLKEGISSCPANHEVRPLRYNNSNEEGCETQVLQVQALSKTLSE